MKDEEESDEDVAAVIRENRLDAKKGTLWPAPAEALPPQGRVKLTPAPGQPELAGVQPSLRPLPPTATQEERNELARQKASLANVPCQRCPSCQRLQPAGSKFCFDCSKPMHPEGVSGLDLAWLRATGGALQLDVLGDYTVLEGGKGKGPRPKGNGKLRADPSDDRRLRGLEGRVRDHARKMDKRAKQFGFDSPEERLLADHVYAYRLSNRHRWGPGWPGTAKALAAAAALLAQRATAAAPVTEIAVRTGGNGMGLVLVSLPKLAWGNPSTSMMLITLVVVVASLSFFCGLTCTSALRCCYRFTRGGLARAIWGAPEPARLRTVGVQSQATYLRETNPPRFQSQQNGFRRAGEVTIELHDQ